MAMLVAASVTKASADFTTVTLPTLDTDIRTYTGGAAYNPLFPSSTQTLGGVPFSFQADASGNTAYIGGGPLHIPVNVSGVTSAYTLINSAWGTAGSTAGTVTFNGSGGLTYSVDLIEGQNIRDHFFGGFENTISDPSVTQDAFGTPGPGNAHLDMQRFDLPAAFAGAVLDEIVFEPLGGNPTGRAFLVAATVATPGVPDAGSTAVLFAMAGGLLIAARSRTSR